MSQFALIEATVENFALIEHMWPFYVYDLTRYCGHKLGWQNPTEITFKNDNVSHYFQGTNAHTFLILIEKEYVGFVNIKQLEVVPEVDWYMNEFYIISKYQKHGIGQAVANEIFKKYNGEWSVGVLPENLPALHFWRKTINNYTQGLFHEEYMSKEQLITNEHPDPYPMIMLRFQS